jgi:16S rRNA (cytidine1402-2'-O)-methyltransferase
MGMLYLVATPIGNMEDITFRALRVLREVSLIAAEDTRHSRKLLNHYQIKTPVVSYHEHNKLTRQEEILNALAEGDVALISDAGTPGLSDPGYELVQAAIREGYIVSPIPGASAPIAAMVASGLPSDAFIFLGYLPRKASGRRRLLESISSEARTMIAFEVPHRLRAALADIGNILGEKRSIAICREITKIHEEISRGELCMMEKYFSEVEPQGEFTLVIAGAVESEHWDADKLRAAVMKRLHDGMPPSEIAKQLAAESDWMRREIYKLIQEVK